MRTTTPIRETLPPTRRIPKYATDRRLYRLTADIVVLLENGRPTSLRSGIQEIGAAGGAFSCVGTAECGAGAPRRAREKRVIVRETSSAIRTRRNPNVINSSRPLSGGPDRRRKDYRETRGGVGTYEFSSHAKPARRGKAVAPLVLTDADVSSFRELAARFCELHPFPLLPFRCYNDCFYFTVK